MMQLPVQGQYLLKPTTAALSVILYSCLLLGFASVAAAAEADLKVGDTIGPQNWQKIQGMVGENLLSRIKAGYTIQIKASKVYQPLKEYVEATEKYSGKVSLGANGELLNYVAGQPFPKLDPNDSADRSKTGLEFFLSLVGRRLQNWWRGQRRENPAVCHREGRVGAPRGCGFLLSFSKHALHIES